MNKINVIAFGGLGGNLFSAGLKTILMRLDGVPGIDFKTYEDYTSWRKWSATLRSWRDPTVLIGHSFGVTAFLAAARGSGKAFPLAISFDPSQWWWSNLSLMGSGGNSVPANIAKVINFYQGNGLIGRQSLERVSGLTTGIENKLITGTMHEAIEDIPDLQQRAVAEIKSLIARLNPPQPKAA